MVNVESLAKIDTWDACFIISALFNNRIYFEFAKIKKLKTIYKHNLLLSDHDTNSVIVFLVSSSSLEYY